MKYLCIVFISLLLSGCGVKYVYITERVATEIPESLFIYPKTPEPMESEEYLTLTTSEKEVYLASHILKLYKVVSSYKTVVDNIKDYVEQHKGIVERITKESDHAHPD